MRPDSVCPTTGPSWSSSPDWLAASSRGPGHPGLGGGWREVAPNATRSGGGALGEVCVHLVGKVKGVTDQRPDRQDDTEADERGQISEGPSGLAGGPEQLGGADAVPDTPDKNFPEDSSSPGRGSALPDE